MEDSFLLDSAALEKWTSETGIITYNFYKKWGFYDGIPCLCVNQHPPGRVVILGIVPEVIFFLEAENKNAVVFVVRRNERLFETAFYQFMAHILEIPVGPAVIFKVPDAADGIPTEKFGVGKAQNFVDTFRVFA